MPGQTAPLEEETRYPKSRCRVIKMKCQQVSIKAWQPICWMKVLPGALRRFLHRIRRWNLKKYPAGCYSQEGRRFPRRWFAWPSSLVRGKLPWSILDACALAWSWIHAAPACAVICICSGSTLLTGERRLESPEDRVEEHETEEIKYLIVIDLCNGRCKCIAEIYLGVRGLESDSHFWVDLRHPHQ